MWIRRFGPDLYWFNPHAESWDRYSPADADAALSGMVGSSDFWANYLTQIDIGDSGLARPVVWSVDEAATFDTGAAVDEFLFSASVDPRDETTIREALVPAGEWAAVLDEENSLTMEALGRLGQWDAAGNWVHPYDFGIYEGALLKTETDVLDIVRFDPGTLSYVVATQVKTQRGVYGYSTEYWGAGYLYTGSVRVLGGDIEVFGADPQEVLSGPSSGLLLEPDLAEGFVSSASWTDLSDWSVSSGLPGIDRAGLAPLVALNVRSYVPSEPEPAPTPAPNPSSGASAAGTDAAVASGSAAPLGPAAELPLSEEAASGGLVPEAGGNLGSLGPAGSSASGVSGPSPAAASVVYTAQPIDQAAGSPTQVAVPPIQVAVPLMEGREGAVDAVGSGGMPGGAPPPGMPGVENASAPDGGPSTSSSGRSSSTSGGGGRNGAGLATGVAGAASAVGAVGGIGTVGFAAAVAASSGRSLFAGSAAHLGRSSRGETILVEGAVLRPGAYRAETLANALHAARPRPSADLARVRITHRDGRIETVDLTAVLAGRAPSFSTRGILRVFIPRKEMEPGVEPGE